jgi:thiol-disulfide isomerase/thioredoxin
VTRATICSFASDSPDFQGTPEAFGRRCPKGRRDPGMFLSRTEDRAVNRDVVTWADRRGRRGFIGGSLALRTLWASLIALSLIPPGMTLAQQAGQPGEGPDADALSRIDADYQQQRTRIDRERIERLTRLAASQRKGEAELTYLEVFRFAIACDRYVPAEPAAERVISSGTTSQEVEFLAQLVNIIAEAERGDYDGSMRDLKAYLGAATLRAAPAPQIQARTVLTIGEAYFRRLVQGRRFDLARDVCDLIISREPVNQAVRDHFAGYRRRLDLVGRPAPAIQGTDVDGGAVRLDDLKDKVVLVVFWATWCNPCVEKIPILNRTLELYEKDGFAILGVNLDSGPERVRLVRRFLVEFGIPWPNVLGGEGVQDIAGSYAVSEIPANLLIGRDGKVVTFDLTGAELLQAVSQAVRPPSRPR